MVYLLKNNSFSSATDFLDETWSSLSPNWFYVLIDSEPEPEHSCLDETRMSLSLNWYCQILINSEPESEHSYPVIKWPKIWIYSLFRLASFNTLWTHPSHKECHARTVWVQVSNEWNLSPFSSSPNVLSLGLGPYFCLQNCVTFFHPLVNYLILFIYNQLT